jgi:hypothetical protein
MFARFLTLLFALVMAKPWLAGAWWGIRRVQ